MFSIEFPVNTGSEFVNLYLRSVRSRPRNRKRLSSHICLSSTILPFLIATGCSDGSVDGGTRTAEGGGSVFEDEPANTSLVLSTVEFDSDLDGVVDSVIYFKYDANGYEQSSEVDHNADGQIDSIALYTVDSNGYLMRAESDFTADGVINAIQYIAFSADGNKTTTEIDSDADGVTDSVIITTNHVEINTMIGETNDSIDGVVDTIVTTVYRAGYNSKLAKNVGETWRYNYANASALVTENSDFNADGVVDHSIVFSAGDNDRTVFETIDANMDGVPEITYKHSYDVNGKLANEEIDFGADGVINATVVYTWIAL